MASSSTKHFNYFKEKLILQEEEKALKKMLDKFQDQLNRLKIEELALMHLIKMQSASEPVKTEKGNAEHVAGSSRSFDSISDIASNTSSVIPVGLMVENMAHINEETVDLKVDPLHLGQDNKRLDDFEEEEEEEDEEMDEDDTYSQQLRSYMDNI